MSADGISQDSIVKTVHTLYTAMIVPFLALWLLLRLINRRLFDEISAVFSASLGIAMMGLMAAVIPWHQGHL